MAQTILNEVRKLRNEDVFDINSNNTNRYSLIVNEKNHTFTAYCFGCPIYNYESKKIVDRVFEKSQNGFVLKGSNSNIFIGRDGIKGERYDGKSFFVNINCGNLLYENTYIKAGKLIIQPTLNGVALRIPIENLPFSFNLNTDENNYQTRHNTKYFALMEEKFVPFVVLSAIGESDERHKISAPAIISCKSVVPDTTAISINSTENKGQYVLLEINMYEPKLFQDTTVETGHLLENNAFGTVGFIGKSISFGEQWLYIRPDITKLSFLHGKHINSVKLLLPVLNGNRNKLEMYRTAHRFCSFGSTWDNKVFVSNKVCEGVSLGNFEEFDITHVLSDSRTNFMIRTDGLIVRTKSKTETFTTIATGDSLFSPPILKINFA